MEYYQSNEKDVLLHLKSDEKQGLNEKEATKRLNEFGKNALSIESKISPFKIFFSQIKSPLIIILIIAAIIAFFFNSHEGGYIDSILILIIVFLNVLFGFFQDYKAEKSIEALQKLSVAKAKVIRDGVVHQINSEKLVPGDIVLIDEGEKIPADLRIISCNELHIDESILTGESATVVKHFSKISKTVGLADQKNLCFMNTIVTRGDGVGVVIKTGMKTEVGKIAKSLETTEKSTPFESELNNLGKKIGFLVIGLILIISVIQLGRLGVNNWIKILMIAVSLGVAAIPEGLPAVVTLALAIGTKKMLKKNSLVRRLSVIQGLGTVDVICTDKTGTLTENMMTVRKLFFNNQFIDLSGIGYNSKGHFSINKQFFDPLSLKPLLEAGFNCNNSTLGKDEHNNKKYLGDPTEIALLISAIKGNVNARMKKVNEIPFSSETKFMITVHKQGKQKKAFIKGAPEEVLKKCKYYLKGKSILKLTDNHKKSILESNKKMASEALRVLGFGYKVVEKDYKKDFIFVGLQGMIDPPRKNVKDAISACHSAGIEVKMITGDNLQTAKAIAAEVGITGKAVDGQFLNRLSPNALKRMLPEIRIFARVEPQHKIMIVKALKELGHRVAMTGDGVNDAPALKGSDVAISMGRRGSDLAKEVSDIILMDDNFVTIKEAIKEGRTIFNNIRKFVTFLLSTNIAEVLTVFVLSLFGFIPLTAVQLLWINLLTDGFPALALGVDPAQKHIMKQKPLKKGEGIINKSLIKNVLTIGPILFILTSILYFIGLKLDGKALAVSLTFCGFVIYEMLVIANIRMKEKTKIFSNKWLILAILLSLALQLTIVYTPLNKVFNVLPLSLLHWAIIFGMGLVGLALLVLLNIFKKD
jgi:P-type Ca2+ transporter type 2C